MWFMPSGGRCYRFDLGSESLEVSEELAGGNASEHDTAGDNPVRFWGVSYNGFVKPGICEGNRYVAVYGTNTYDLACEYLSLI